MANLQIPDELDVQLQQTAERLGCRKDELIAETLWSHADFVEAPLTEAEVERMRRGIERLDRGEFITDVEVDAKFADLYRRLASR